MRHCWVLGDHRGQRGQWVGLILECTKINSEDWIARVIYLRNPKRSEDNRDASARSGASGTAGSRPAWSVTPVNDPRYLLARRARTPEAAHALAKRCRRAGNTKTMGRGSRFINLQVYAMVLSRRADSNP
jgi:hypothetical protein